MPRIWVFCRRTKLRGIPLAIALAARRGNAAQAHIAAEPKCSGFTLLEMLVVLALLALMTGLVAPWSSGWLMGARERGLESDLRAYLEAMPIRAFHAGEARQVEAEELLSAISDRSGHVILKLDKPLRYAANGFAEGGKIEIIRGARRDVWLVEAVSGQVREAP
ncbi:prepilin-type N-terminal cleavage/methylation domain-containing protein [Roseateles paludis]|uniref:Prepilin-type N-terminal cleavage/methylation domain-containing protein n=1 Tax=Roseateles paludis TaxID=3145238 RepID=A0ABV0G6E3_9BURK